MLLLTYHDAIQWLKGFMLICPSKRLLHIECPGCGFQRSFFALLDGNFNKSLQLYPAMLPILLLIAFTILHIKYQFSFGAVIIKYFFILIAVIILAFYIYKIMNQKIFC
ncbi:MAG: DUF2752 domain-containing protein [Deinococcales bacterium]|nr:DUF2752 domain-containing protein [Chitinophagaceae bacterium]